MLGFIRARGETWPGRSSQEVMKLIPSVGGTLPLVSDYPEVYGEEEKDYKVIYCQDGAIQFQDELRTVTNMVLVIVTDPDDDS